MGEKITILLDLLYFMLDAVIINRVMQYMLEYKDKRYCKWLYMILIYSIFLMNYILLHIPFLDTPIITSIVSVVMYVGIFLLTELFYKGEIGEKIFSVFAYIVLASVSELFIIIMTMVLFQISQKDIMQNNLIFLQVMGSTKVLQLIEVDIIRRIKNKRKHTMQIKFTFEMGSILIVYFFALIITIAISNWNQFFIKYAQLYITMILMLFLGASLVVIIVILKLLKRKNEEIELKNHVRQIELEKEYNDKIKEIEHHLRSLRHDMNNHMNVMKGLLYLGEYDELKQYFSEINEDLEKANQMPLLENKAFAVLLNEKVKRAEEAGIALELEMSRESSDIPASELCSLAGNLLDNAIEAVQKLKENKYIRFSFSVNQKSTELFCENPYDKMPVEKNGRFLSIKEDKINHGLGTRNIQEIVEKNHGELHISYDTDFCVHIILPHQTKPGESGPLE